MLLQFMVENYKSFKSEAVLNLAPAKSRIHPDHVLTNGSQGKAVKAMPLAVLYGANASGKSVLVQALAFAKELITSGTRGEESISVDPFRLDPESKGKPSRFEFILKHEGVLYTYGFVVSAKQVHEEWLFAVFNKQEVRLFERVTRDGRAVVEFGDQLEKTGEEKQRLQFVAQGTRPNQLLLTEANERNVESLKPLVHWFQNNLQIIFPNTQYDELIPRAEKQEDFARFIESFLRIADTGIEGVNIQSVPLRVPESDRALFDRFAQDAGFSLPSDGRCIDFKAETELSLRTQHKTTTGTKVDFEVQDESDGTRRIMHLAPALYDSISAEKVYVIDELDRSMHPLLCRLYVEAFLEGIKQGNCQGQMILTTHETNLLDLDLLRRDEIWFVEKDKEGGSHLTSLADFKPIRADLKISKGYLSGRFGAIPFLGDIRRLFPKGAKA